MKGIVSLVIITILALSGIGSYAIQDIEKQEITSIKESVLISTPRITTRDQFFSIDLDESTSYKIIEGEPVIPKITKVYHLPIGCKIIDVSVEFIQPEKMIIVGEIIPAFPALIEGSTDMKKPLKSKAVYESKDFYPSNDYSYRTTTGIYEEEQVLFLSIQCYPVKYSPVLSELIVWKEMQIQIEYNPPLSPVIYPDESDLLIIAPSVFSEGIQPLIEHKNNHNMRTTFLTLEEIYQQYTTGRDEQENIKIAIRDAKETLGIKFVLLIGGRVGQSYKWYIPVRYGHSPSEEAYLSDLYYSDLYKIVDEELVYEDWDANGNGIIAEFSLINRDIIDGAPDVHIGRLACRDENQLKTVIQKIINYEKQPADESWFKRMLLIGGDTYHNSGDRDGYEAEIDTNLSASYMDGFEIERIWASLGTLTGQADVERGINQGAGFIHMAGHANPSILVTHPPNDNAKITILHMYNLPIFNALGMITRKKGIDRFIEELTKPRFPSLSNQEKLPVILVGGCHNSQFNTTLLYILKDGFMHAYGWGEFVPKCWSWWLTSHENGGAIAVIGNTGLGMGLPGFDYVNGLDGWLYPRFFFNYRQNSMVHVGEAHSAAITDYVNEFDINKDGEDRQMIQQWALLGDPSLMLGGYSK